MSDDTRKQWDDLKVRDGIGITAHVERNTEEGEAVMRANRALNDIGDFIHANTPGLKGLKYLGSSAVHIFCAEALGEVAYITQTQPLLDTEERIAGPAYTQLQKDMMKYYGRKTTKIRSGF